MSYILDALKKAERERELTKIPTIETVHEYPPKKRKGVWIAAGCGVICLAVAGMLFFLLSTKYPDIPTAMSEYPVQGSETQGSADTIQDAFATEAMNVPIEAVSETEFVYEFGWQEDEDQGIGVTTVPAVAAMKTETMFESLSVHDNATSFMIEPTKTDASNLKSQVSSGPLQSLREIAASMRMTIHVYSDTVDKRMVYINGIKYTEGDFMEHNCVLESITPDGAVLRRGEETIYLRFGR